MLVGKIENFMNKIDEAETAVPQLKRQHYVWFLEILADGCRKAEILPSKYLALVEAILDDFTVTNPNFKKEMFLTYAKKQFKELGNKK
jgi:hypothetical protein